MDPSPGVSISDLIEGAESVWQAFVAPGGLAALGFAFKMYSDWQKRRDDKKTGEDTATRALADLNAKERLQLSTEMKEWLERQAARIKDQDAELESMRIKNARVTIWWEEARDAASEARLRCNAIERELQRRLSDWKPWSWDTKA